MERRILESSPWSIRGGGGGVIVSCSIQCWFSTVVGFTKQVSEHDVIIMNTKWRQQSLRRILSTYFLRNIGAFSATSFFLVILDGRFLFILDDDDDELGTDAGMTVVTSVVVVVVVDMISL
jgi:hypothetical protein